MTTREARRSAGQRGHHALPVCAASKTFPAWWAAAVSSAALACACIDTTMVQFANVQAPLPAPARDGDWKGELDALFEHYERMPVIAPRDAHLEPMFGGLATLSYYGADVRARVLDQKIPPGQHTPGVTLKVACAGVEDERDAPLRPESPGLPELTAVWIPLSRHGGPANAATRCDDAGRATGDAENEAFCMFARVALQSGGAHPLTIVVHGLFDSSAQEYVQRMAAVLYHMGNSVLIPDMRDHGDTFRAAPSVATTLGNLEGRDILTLVAAARRDCGAVIGPVSLVGVSGGGLDAIRAWTQDDAQSLDGGVIALSPLLDIDTAIHDVTTSRACFATRSIELTWKDEFAVSALTGGAFFAGAGLARALNGEPPDARSALAAGIGASLGLLGALAVDAWFDGGSAPCIAESSIARILAQVVSVRWQTLRGDKLGITMSSRGQSLDPSKVSLENYVHERAEFLAARAHMPLHRFTAQDLAIGIRAALAAGKRPSARLLVLGAHDDPLTREPAFTEFARGTRALPELYVRSVRHGGHGAMWVVQPDVMDAVFARFFGGRGVSQNAAAPGPQR